VHLAQQLFHINRKLGAGLNQAEVVVLLLLPHKFLARWPHCAFAVAPFAGERGELIEPTGPIVSHHRRDTFTDQLLGRRRLAALAPLQQRPALHQVGHDIFEKRPPCVVSEVERRILGGR
jgi:hypothetical protein